MNNAQLKHLATTLSVISFAEFAAFGYAGLKATPPAIWHVYWAGLLFIALQVIALTVLSRVREDCEEIEEESPEDEP